MLRGEACARGGIVLCEWGYYPVRLGAYACGIGAILCAWGRPANGLVYPVLRFDSRTGTLARLATGSRPLTIAAAIANQNGDADEMPGRAMRVAHALQSRGGEEFAKPGTLVEVRFVKGQSLSLTAARLLALMILSAGGDAWEPVAHRMRKADIRRAHKSNERISEMLEELHRTLFATDDLSWRGRKATKRFSLIQSSREEVEEEGGETGWIEWEFTPDARRLIRESESYAVLNRQAVLSFRSAYALRLYELGALRLHRRQPTWRADLTAIRAALGIPPTVYPDFAQVRRAVIEKAQAEINSLAHFTVDWRAIRRGRTVVEIEFTFHPKTAPAGSPADLVEDRVTSHATTVGTASSHTRALPSPAETERREDAPSRKGTPRKAATSANAAVPRPAEVGAVRFPSGSLRFAPGPFGDIAVEHGGGWERDLIATAYRSEMGPRLEKLTGVKLVRSWTGFCQAFAARRGRP